MWTDIKGRSRKKTVKIMTKYEKQRKDKLGNSLQNTTNKTLHTKPKIAQT